MLFRLLLSAFLIISVLLPVPSLALRFTEHVITDDLEPVSSIYSIDIDQDNDMDIICATGGGADNTPGRISWFENDGEGSFNEHVILEDVEFGLNVKALDFDDDGDIDILVAISTQWVGESGRVIWLENDGEEEFEEHVVTDDLVGVSSAAAGDVDDDGDMDLIAASQYSNMLFEYYGALGWWENRGEDGFIEHEIIEEGWNRPFIDVETVDLDFDGDPDIIAGRYGIRLIWYENDGEGAFEEHEFSDRLVGLASFAVTDLDRDDDIDIVATGLMDEVAWWENDGDLNFTRHDIGRYVGCGQTVDVADINDDGSPDVIAGNGGLFAENGTISWWSNEGEGIFNYHRITNRFAPVSIKAVDIDGDDDVDIVSGSYSGVISWWEQVEEDERFDTLFVMLDADWSFITIPMIPQIIDVERIFSPVVDRNNLRILKDYQGHFYLPGRFNNIPFYNVDEGYSIKLNEPDTLIVLGYEVIDGRPLHLPEGWSTVAYFPSDTVDAHTAFYFFRPYLIIAKDDKGHFYVPGYSFCNMPPLTCWNGYQIKMSRYWEAGWNTDPRE